MSNEIIEDLRKGLEPLLKHAQHDQKSHGNWARNRDRFGDPIGGIRYKGGFGRVDSKNRVLDDDGKKVGTIRYNRGERGGYNQGWTGYSHRKPTDQRRWGPFPTKNEAVRAVLNETDGQSPAWTPLTPKQKENLERNRGRYR